jgi:hypothetical protein
VLLPTAFRSLPRPSSPVCAKASPVCPYRAWPESIQRARAHDPKAIHANTTRPPEGAVPDFRPHHSRLPNVLVLLSQPPELSKNLAYLSSSTSERARCRVLQANRSACSIQPLVRGGRTEAVRSRIGSQDPEISVWWVFERATSELLSALASVLACSRKEVIQPQVPLRLPCYDFAPVTELAFGRSLPCGLGDGLRALPASMA